MSEHEFNAYLSVLSRLLRLEPGQREEIADELRDHLSERLDELLRAGCSREEAIRRALDEFGDAAGLAARFTYIVTSRKRRKLMRLTLGTLGVTAVVVFAGLALWPEVPGQPAVAPVVAQQQVQQPATHQPEEPKYYKYYDTAGARQAAAPEMAVDAKLRKPLEDVSFTETPLGDVIEYVSQSAEVDIFVDRQLREQELALDEPVTLEIRHAKLPAGTVLELALNQAGLGEIAGYTVRDGFVYITSKSQSNQIRVYNVRDLVFGGQTSGMEMGMGYDSGMGGMYPGGEMAAPGMGLPGSSAGGTALTQVIRSTIQPGSWVEAAGMSGVAEYNGLLIVKAGEEVHREIEQLLQMMRSAMRGGTGGGEAATTIIPVPRR